MSTLAEIAQAVDSLPRPEQEALLRQLSQKLGGAPVPQWPVPPLAVSRDEIRRVPAEIDAGEADDRTAAAQALLQSWLDEDPSSEQVETGAWLVQRLEEDRAGQRSLFPQELRGVTW